MSAYIGAAKHISDKSYLTMAGVGISPRIRFTTMLTYLRSHQSILAVEARHNSWVSFSVEGGEPWEGAFDVPLIGTGAVTLAAQFIMPESCPLANGELPFIPFPDLGLSSTSLAPGEPLTVNLLGLLTETFQAVYLAWFDGPSVLYTPIGLLDGLTMVPEDLHGPVLVAVVSSKDHRPSNASLLSRIAVVQIAK